MGRSRVGKEEDCWEQSATTLSETNKVARSQRHQLKWAATKEHATAPHLFRQIGAPARSDFGLLLLIPQQRRESRHSGTAALGHFRTHA
jgi:hypothetical protein